MPFSADDGDNNNKDKETRTTQKTYEEKTAGPLIPANPILARSRRLVGHITDRRSKMWLLTGNAKGRKAAVIFPIALFLAAWSGIYGLMCVRYVGTW